MSRFRVTRKDELTVELGGDIMVTSCTNPVVMVVMNEGFVSQDSSREGSAGGVAALRYPEAPQALQNGGFLGLARYFGPGAIIASVTIGSGETEKNGATTAVMRPPTNICSMPPSEDARPAISP